MGPARAPPSVCSMLTQGERIPSRPSPPGMLVPPRPFTAVERYVRVPPLGTEVRWGMYSTGRAIRGLPGRACECGARVSGEGKETRSRG